MSERTNSGYIIKTHLLIALPNNERNKTDKERER